MKIVTIIGARPQFVKAAAFNRLVQKTNDVDEVIIHTGQHYDKNMSDAFFRPLGIKCADYFLGVSGGSHGNMTGRMLIELEPVIQAESPDWVLTYGDTNSTLAAALVAAKLHIPIAHIEAGLRSFNRRMPEEINRIVTDHTSDLLLCPTKTAMDNLKREGLSDKAVLTGDIMYDASLYAYEHAKTKSSILAKLGLKPEQFILATIHRAESTQTVDTLNEVLDYLKVAAVDMPVVLPLHPRTKNAVADFGCNLDGINIIEPVDSLDMANLLANCSHVLTDSGGVQKEAYFFKKPCVTLRDETEWVETIENGWNRLWKSGQDYRPRQNIKDYGTGKAAENILAALRKFRLQ